MRLVHVGTIIDFAEDTVPTTPAYKIVRALGQGKPKTKVREPGVNIQDDKMKVKFNWSYEDCRVLTESRQSQTESIEGVVEIIESINEVAPIGKLKRIGYDAFWILPMKNRDFGSLNELYKETMIKQVPFIGEAIDSSVVLDFNRGDFTLHHQSGPMEPLQLQGQYLEFDGGKLPKLFLFLITGTVYFKVVEYSKEAITNIFNIASEHCERHSKEFAKLWE
ncbi:hypothetical protein ACFLWM_00435 [Chloroflexota bacterium]